MVCWGAFFASCSKKDYDTKFADKNNVVLLEVEVSENSPYADYPEYVKWKGYLHSYLKFVYSDMWYGKEEEYDGWKCKRDTIISMAI